MSDAVTYTATLPVARSTVEWLAALLADHRVKIGTRTGRRSLSCFAQAVAFLRWMLDATTIERLAVDNEVSLSTGHRNVREALAVVRAQAPDLEGALDAARQAGYHHVMIDAAVIATDRSRAIGPTAGVDLWWSGKHHHHGGNVQVITAPDGWPIWTSAVRPGREHDTTCVRAHHGLLEAVDAWRADGKVVLADLGYQGEAERMIVPVKKKRGVKLSVDEKCFNALHSATRALAERGNALLKMTFTALRHVTVSPGRIGDMAAAALAILHVEHHRTA